MSTILLFDDVPENRQQLATVIDQNLHGLGSIKQFLGDYEAEGANTYEQSIESFLRHEGLVDDIGLVACDKELGLYEQYRGLSANAVSAVARNLGIPFCQFSRNPGGQGRELQRFSRLRQWDSEDITLDGEGTESWGKEIAELYRGFCQIERFYSEKPEIKQLKPPNALARIAGRPDAATRIALYGSGDQSVLTEIFAFVGDEEQSIEKRMPRILGTWLLLSLLRFPGLLVGPVSAASYLNIAPEDFERHEVVSLFESALYQGPFAGLSPRWWRADLDDLIFENGVGDGKEMLSKQQIDVRGCVDSKNERAGYYCMITQEPVSRENSTGDINWFPSGADLSRIENDKYDEITSLVSL